MAAKGKAVLAVLLACAGPSLAQNPLPPSARPVAVDLKPAFLTAERLAAEEQPSCFWVNADYLYWWIKGTPTTPLVSTGNQPDPRLGALGQPSTQVLSGNDNGQSDGRSGMKITAGLWCDGDRRLGLDTSYFWLDRVSSVAPFSSDANGNPYLARPFLDGNGNESAFIVGINAALRGGPPLAGGVSVSRDTRVHGYEANVAARLAGNDRFQLTGLAGFRSLTLKESLVIRETVRDDGGSLFFLNSMLEPTSTLNFVDAFETHNQFVGGQVGAKLDWHSSRLNISAVGKVGVGSTEELSFIAGATTLVRPTGELCATQGGILAQSTNIGRHFERDFAVVPEFGLNVSCDVTSWLNVRAGYSFLYWSKVARPGNLVDRAINLNNVPTDPRFGTPGGPARPALLHDTSDFWLHGVTVGVELKF